MTEIPSRIINGFATGVTRLFAQSAKGLDGEAERFVARRPYERILTGFLTPVAVPEHADDPGAAADLSSDESYEQTNLGFEWRVPLESINTQSRVKLQFGLHVYVRVLPTFSEARANARFRQGVWRVTEVWQRVPLAEIDVSPSRPRSI